MFTFGLPLHDDKCALQNGRLKKKKTAEALTLSGLKDLDYPWRLGREISPNCHISLRYPVHPPPCCKNRSLI